jgi:DNA-binding CsgD family transcriptional regulator
VDSDAVSYNELDRGTGEEHGFVIEPGYAEFRSRGGAYRSHVYQHPVFDALDSGRLRPGRTVSVSDLLGARAFRRLPLYTEYYRHRGVEDQLVASLGTTGGRTTLLVLSRSRRGFGARDRAVVEHLVPHLRQALGHRRRLRRLRRTVAEFQSRTPVPLEELTPRQREVVECLATGATDQQIGHALAISTRTVGKHLEAVYRTLALPGRTALLAAMGGAHLG